MNKECLGVKSRGIRKAVKSNLTAMGKARASNPDGTRKAASNPRGIRKATGIKREARSAKNFARPVRPSASNP